MHVVVYNTLIAVYKQVSLCACNFGGQCLVVRSLLEGFAAAGLMHYHKHYAEGTTSSRGAETAAVSNTLHLPLLHSC